MKAAAVSVQVTTAPLEAPTPAPADPSVGAIVTFEGLCRDEGGRLAALELEHYPGMAELEIEAVAEEAARRFSLQRVTVAHRSGLVQPGEVIVRVTAAAAHRREAFAGAEMVMDFLKERAPFWKREHRRDAATGGWVEAKESDAASAARWTSAP